MSQKHKIEILWSEFTLIENINDRRVLIHSVVKNKRPKYQILAKDDPYRFFELLGGDKSEINSNNGHLNILTKIISNKTILNMTLKKQMDGI
jgi:hypothetical protein